MHTDARTCSVNSPFHIDSGMKRWLGSIERFELGGLALSLGVERAMVVSKALYLVLENGHTF